MKKIFSIILIVSLSVMTSGCFVSEEEHQGVIAERDALTKKVEELEKENKTLNQSIFEVYKERENLIAELKECELQERTATVIVEPAPRPVPVEPADDRPLYYEVKHGDTLSAIARKTGVPMSTLVRLNNIDEDLVLAGQKLRLREE